MSNFGERDADPDQQRLAEALDMVREVAQLPADEATVSLHLARMLEVARRQSPAASFVLSSS